MKKSKRLLASLLAFLMLLTAVPITGLKPKASAANPVKDYNATAAVESIIPQ